MNARFAPLVLLALFLPAIASAEQAYDAAKVAAAVPDVVWERTPLDVSNGVSEGSVVWLGEIADVRVRGDEASGAIVEWLARHLCLSDLSAKGLNEPVAVRDRQTGYFMLSFTFEDRSPDEARRQMVESVGDHAYMLVAGKPIEVVDYDEGRRAVHIEAVTAALSNELEVRRQTPDTEGRCK